MTFRILALDLGTQTGWATCSEKGILSGTESFHPRKGQGRGSRWIALRRWLSDVKRWHDDGFDLVVVERVIRHSSADSAHVYGGLLAHVEAWCESHGVRMESVSPGTIKKFATGKGNSDKAAMLEAARAAGFSPRDDNEADALHLLRYTIQQGSDPAGRG